MDTGVMFIVLFLIIKLPEENQSIKQYIPAGDVATKCSVS